MLASILANITVPFLFKYVIDGFEKSGSSLTLHIIILCYGIVWFIAHIGEHLRDFFSVRIIERASRDGISNFYQIILEKSRNITSNILIGSILNKIFLFRDGFYGLIWSGIFYFLPIIIQSLGNIIVLWFFYGAIYGLIFIVTIVIYFIYTVYSLAHYLKIQKRAVKTSSSLSDFMGDRFSKLETIYIFNAEESENSLILKRLSSMERVSLRSRQAFEFIRIIQGIIISVSLVFVIYWSIYQSVAASQELSDFFVIYSYMLQLFMPLHSLGIILSEMYHAFSQVEDICEELNNQINSKGYPFYPIKAQLSQSHILTVENLSYSSPENPSDLLLNNLNFSIKKGWKIGIIGPSGSGKSTLAKLLAGVLQPTKGQILIANDIEYKHEIAFVPQDVQIFHDSVRKNLIYAYSHASEQEIKTVVSRACLEDLIRRLPDGLNTILGESIQISGGERQRIGIARALLRAPKIYILDEPTSALDMGTAGVIKQHFKDMRGVTTQIIITHDISFIQDADWLILLEGGRICLQGHPQDVLTTFHPSFL